MSDNAIRNVLAVTLLVIIVFTSGICFEHWLLLRQVERTSADRVSVEGHTLDACSLGCRTEEDVACVKFVDLIRKR